MSCTIKIDNLEEKYYPGDHIFGKLCFTFPTQQSVEEISIELVAREFTKWVGRSKSSNGTFSGSNIIFHKKETLLGASEFGAGVHELYFDVELPKNFPQIPSSFQSKWGWIKYFLIPHIKSGVPHTKSVNIEVCAPKTIEDVFIAYLTPFTDGAKREYPRTLFSQCFPVGDPECVTMEVYMQQRVFQQGEERNVRVHVTNSSDRDVKGVQLTIGKIIEHKVVKPLEDTKIQHEVIYSDFKHRGDRGNRSGDYNFSVKIPTSVELPNFVSSKLFFLQCYLQVTTVLRGDKLKLFTIAMVIQSSPDTPTSDQSPNSTTDQPQLTATTQDVPRRLPQRSSAYHSDVEPQPEAPLVDPDDPPPSYELACGETSITRRTRRNVEFAPSAPAAESLSSAPSLTRTFRIPMPMPTITPATPVESPLYPPQFVSYPTEETLTRWDKLISEVTKITPSAARRAFPGNAAIREFSTSASTSNSASASVQLYGLNLPPICPVPPLAESVTPVSDRLYPPPLSSVRVPAPLCSDAILTTDSSEGATSGDGLYPPPIESVEPPRASTSSIPSLRQSTVTNTIVPSSGNVLYPSPIDSVRSPSSTSSIPTLRNTLATLSGDGLYPPPIDSDQSSSFPLVPVGLSDETNPPQSLYPSPMESGRFTVPSSSASPEDLALEATLVASGGEAGFIESPKDDIASISTSESEEHWVIRSPSPTQANDSGISLKTSSSSLASIAEFNDITPENSDPGATLVVSDRNRALVQAVDHLLLPLTEEVVVSEDSSSSSKRTKKRTTVRVALVDL